MEAKWKKGKAMLEELSEIRNTSPASLVLYNDWKKSEVFNAISAWYLKLSHHTSRGSISH